MLRLKEVVYRLARLREERTLSILMPLASRDYNTYSLCRQARIDHKCHVYYLVYVACGAIEQYDDPYKLDELYELEVEIAKQVDPKIIVTRGKDYFTYSLDGRPPPERDPVHFTYYGSVQIIPPEKLLHVQVVLENPLVAPLIHRPFVDFWDPNVASSITSQIITAREVMRRVFGEEVIVKFLLDRKMDNEAFRAAYGSLNAEVKYYTTK